VDFVSGLVQRQEVHAVEEDLVPVAEADRADDDGLVAVGDGAGAEDTSGSLLRTLMHLCPV